MCLYASPAIDLSYALYLFLNDENRLKCRDEFIATYHSQFVDSLKSFGYLKAPPSLLDLQIELLRCGAVQAQAAIAIKAFFITDFSTLTPEEMTNPLAYYQKAFNNPVFKKMILDELPLLVYRGFI
jgi:Ecdysteroid kinase-like family